LFRLHDRKGADYLLGPTHEELFTTLVKGEYASYRDYPVTLYQIQTKYRDEARPRAGLLRGREFVMKDSYSFDLDDDGLKKSYDDHRVAYQRIFERLGLDYRIAYAVSGAMGGSASEEFLAPAEYGEDTFVQCTSCDYTANTEAVEIAAPAKQDSSAHPALQVLDTPDTPTIETLVSRLNSMGLGREFTGADTLKNVVLEDPRAGRDDVGAARRRCAGRPRGRPQTHCGATGNRSRSRKPTPMTSRRNRGWYAATSGRRSSPRSACVTSSIRSSYRAVHG